jgi:hypothetical protein
MTIEERMVRRDPEDLIEIGRALDTFYNSEAGAIIRAMCNGRVSQEARQHKEGSAIKPGRALGRIEAYNQLIDDIEIAIAQYHDLTRPQPEEASHEE